MHVCSRLPMRARMLVRLGLSLLRTSEVPKLESKRLLEDLVASPVYRWCGPGLQGVVTAVLDAVLCICEDRQSKGHKLDDPLWLQARSAMAWWCVLDTGLPAAPAPGAECARACFTEIEKKIGASEAVPYSRLRGLLTYSWLLAQRRLLTKWADSAAAAAGQVVAVAGPSAARKGAKGPSAAVQVASLFANSGSGR